MTSPWGNITKLLNLMTLHIGLVIFVFSDNIWPHFHLCEKTNKHIAQISTNNYNNYYDTTKLTIEN